MKINEHFKTILNELDIEDRPFDISNNTYVLMVNVNKIGVWFQGYYSRANDYIMFPYAIVIGQGIIDSPIQINMNDYYDSVSYEKITADKILKVIRKLKKYEKEIEKIIIGG